MLESIKKRLPHLASGKHKNSREAGAATLVSRRRHRLRNVILGALVLLAVFALLGFFVVPPVAKYYLVKTLSEQLGRDVAIQRVEFNPFALNVRVLKLTVNEPHSSQTFFSFDELALNLSSRSLLRLAPVVEHMLLLRPYVHIARNIDGKSYNFSDLLAKFSKPGPSEPAKPTPRFSLNNIQLVSGQVDFDDHPLRAHHAVTEIGLAIPFISNLPDVVDLFVQPSFFARVDGTPVELHGRTKPFKDTLETSIDLNIEHLELPRYVEYLPLKLGFQLASGLLDTRLTASFVRSQGKAPVVVVRGDIGLEKLSIRELDGTSLLNLAALDVPVGNVDVLERKIELGHIALTSPEVFVSRDKQGGINWMSVRPQMDKTTQQSDEAPGAKPSVTLSVAEVAIHDGVIHLKDEVPARGFGTELTGLQASLHEFAMPQTHPAQAELTFNTSHGETVKLAASVLIDPLSSEGMLEVHKVRLKDYEAYYESLLWYRIEDGSVDLSTQYAFASGPDGIKMRLTGLDVALTSVRLRKPGSQEEFLHSKSVKLSNGELDLDKHSLTIGQVALRDSFVNLIREADGAINATRLLVPPKSSGPKSSGPAPQGAPWVVTLQRADAEKCKVAFTDLAMKQPVKISVDDLRLKATNWSTRKDAKAQLSLQAKVNDTGALKLGGTIALNPVAAQLNIELDRISVVPLEPYFTDKVNLLVSSGDVSVKGAASFALAGDGALSASFNGDASLTDLASVDKAKSEDLLKWKSLFLSGVQYQHTPMALSIDQVALSDFYARIIIFPEGRLNLQNITAKPEAEPDTDTKESSDKIAQPTPRAAPPTSTPSASAGTPMPPVKIGTVTLQGGDVAFTDLFIKPNYSADLSDIGGSVTGLSSQLDTTADVILRGRFAKTAPVEIRGKVNPLIKDLYLDIKTTVRDIELGPMSPYSAKYVGYEIEKGKMSFDVAYKIEHRKLTAENRLVLNQLTFGGRVESPQATKLPVLLAVSLLKDRNGDIDVNLPISGSLDDPKFKIGGIILHIIFNLIEKAVTAPFALIANLVGGGSGEELSYVEFDPGRVVLTSAGQEKVGKLQKALVDRPGLKLDITGRVDPELDREGLRHYRFEQQVKAQKLKELVKQGASTRSVDDISIDPKDYEKYLRAAYKDAKFPKPRNVLGFAKDLPVPDMEKLMETNTVVTDDDLVALANQRAQIAKDALTKDGKVPLERVYLLASKVDKKGDDKRKGSRVDFALK
jgi:hypothetical protein